MEFVEKANFQVKYVPLLCGLEYPVVFQQKRDIFPLSLLGLASYSGIGRNS
jgi:hypothetical protein